MNKRTKDGCCGFGCVLVLLSVIVVGIFLLSRWTTGF